MKLVEVQSTKDFANTFLNDIFFRMAVNRVLDNAPEFEMVHCKECRFAIDETSDGWMWCNQWCNGTNCEGYCHMGEKK